MRSLLPAHSFCPPDSLSKWSRTGNSWTANGRRSATRPDAAHSSAIGFLLPRSAARPRTGLWTWFPSGEPPNQHVSHALHTPHTLTSPLDWAVLWSSAAPVVRPAPAYYDLINEHTLGTHFNGLLFSHTNISFDTTIPVNSLASLFHSEYHSRPPSVEPVTAVRTIGFIVAQLASSLYCSVAELATASGDVANYWLVLHSAVRRVPSLPPLPPTPNWKNLYRSQKPFMFDGLSELMSTGTLLV